MSWASFFPEIYQALNDRKLSKFIQSHLCEERERLGSLSFEGKDKWWDLMEDEIQITDELLGLLLENGANYFDHFGSREKLLAEWEQRRLQGRLSERKKLSMAIVLAHGGEKERANELLCTEFSNQYKTAFLEYAQNIAISLGLDFPTMK